MVERELEREREREPEPERKLEREPEPERKPELEREPEREREPEPEPERKLELGREPELEREREREPERERKLELEREPELEPMSNYCKKHPSQKLTELFTSSVCDLCDPPKNDGPLYGVKVSSDLSAWSGKRTAGHTASPPAVGYCCFKAATANALCMLHAGHLTAHVWALPCSEAGCKYFDGHAGKHFFDNPFFDILTDNYPSSVASRIKGITELVDAGVLTIPEGQDWEATYDAAGFVARRTR